ncbi:MAG: TonB-dependent siderophore receptor [Tildeniella torsiva UHER 1998/13D]|nr:TonB-dependent siderophore receptor [Tildeniella torsiva UHER 1998/13D]
MWQVAASVRLALMVLLSGSLVGVVALSVAAQEPQASDELTDQPDAQQPDLSLAPEPPLMVTSESRPLNELDQPATTVEDRVAQIEASLTQITGVRVETTEAGLQILLDTAEGTLATPATQTVGNALIADIPNVVLALPEGGNFEQFGPAEGIALVAVTNEPGNRVRVAITGTDAPPVVAVTATGLAVTLGEAASGPEDEAIQVVVTGEQDEGYNPSQSSTITRTDTPLRDIPQSIQVIPLEVLRDQGVDLTGALLNAPSVRNTAPTNFDSVRLRVRGFITPATVNGFEDSLNSSTIGGDLTGFESIEVLGGPNSVLLGSSAPGGTINLVPRQPLSEPYYFAEVTAGNFNFYRGEVDLSGPLDDSGKSLYRLNTSYRDQQFFSDLSRTRSFVIAPVVSLEFTENTRLTLDTRYADATFDSIPFGLPAAGTILSNPNGQIPRNVNVNEGTFQATSTRFGYTLEHDFSDNWSFRNAFQFTKYAGGYFGNDGGTFPLGLLGDNRTLERVFLNERSEQRDLRFSTNVIGEFATGSVQHQLLLGFDWGGIVGEFGGEDREIAPLDVFNPVYGSLPGAVIPGSAYSIQNVTDELGFIVQDQIALADNLKLLIGGRFDLFQQTNVNVLDDTRTSQSGNAFSPRAGIVYQPIPPISLYANYSRSFQPAIGQAFDGSIFRPTRGTQFEVGVKADFNDRLSTTLALYNITQSNVLTADPDNLGFSVQTGEQRSQGIELSLTGEVLSGWNVFASYAYNDVRVTQDNSIAVGNRVLQTTPHAASLWTTYELQHGSLQGLGFGLGLFYVGDRAGDAGNTFEVPSYLTTDASVFYKRDRFRAAINVRNLFDVNYFESAFNRTRVFPGTPLTIQGSISWTF